jgi:hypothetical protein
MPRKARSPASSCTESRLSELRRRLHEEGTAPALDRPASGSCGRVAASRGNLTAQATFERSQACAVNLGCDAMAIRLHVRFLAAVAAAGLLASTPNPVQARGGGGGHGGGGVHGIGLRGGGFNGGRSAAGSFSRGGFPGGGFPTGGFPGGGFPIGGFPGGGFAGGSFSRGGFLGGGSYGGNFVNPNVGFYGNINRTVLGQGSYGGYGATAYGGGTSPILGAGVLAGGAQLNPGYAALPPVYYPSPVPGAYPRPGSYYPNR